MSLSDWPLMSGPAPTGRAEAMYTFSAPRPNMRRKDTAGFSGVFRRLALSQHLEIGRECAFPQVKVSVVIEWRSMRAGQLNYIIVYY